MLSTPALNMTRCATQAWQQWLMIAWSGLILCVLLTPKAFNNFIASDSTKGHDKLYACRQPQSKIAADILPTGKAAKSALMRKLMKKKPAGAGRAAKVSVEGRGIML